MLAQIVDAVIAELKRRDQAAQARGTELDLRPDRGAATSPRRGVVMAELSKAKFKVFKQDGSFEQIAVQFNPNSLSFEKPVHTADIAIPGLDSPLKQFVRGGAETASVELFFDTTERGTGAGATSVTTLTDAFYGLVKIDPKTHAVPVCSFIWGEKFPGDQLPERYGNQRRTEFSCVVTNVKQDFKFFSPQGTPLRAVLTLKLERVRHSRPPDPAAQSAVLGPHP